MIPYERNNSYSENALQAHVNTGSSQVFLLYSPLPFPMRFSSHSWIVTNNHGKLDRWEVWQRASACDTSWGHVHQNLFEPFTALHKNFFRREKGRYFAHLAGVWENNKEVDALIKFMHEWAGQYPLANRYIYYPGPNSNTFVQWIIDHFPDSGFTLPFSAFGKNFKSVRLSSQKL